MLKATKILLFALFLTIGGSVSATAQTPDKLLIEGKEYRLNTNPLQPYLAKLGDKAPKFEAISSALWRGYVATWELSGGKLYLIKVEVSRPDPASPQDEEIAVDALSELFPGQARVLADWYSGALIVPKGEIVDYVHMGYASTYERYVVSVVKNGLEKDRRDVSLAEFKVYRQSQFEKFKGTPAYKAMFDEEKASEDPMSDREIESFIFEYATETYLSAVAAGDGSDTD